MVVLTLLACTGEVEDDCSSGTSQAWVMRSILFSRFEGDVAAGFDLDDSGGKVCGHDDWDSPWGTDGVDNNLAKLIPALESTEAVAVESILQGLINDGEVLLMLEVAHVDDWQQDSCIEAGVMRGGGPIEVGSDDLLLPHQTLDVSDPYTAEGAWLEDGVISARGFPMELPFQVFDVQIPFALSEAQFRMEVDPETGVATGVAGGATDLQTILDVVNTENVDPELQDLANGLLPAMADMDMDGDGECEAISLAFDFEAVPVWTY
jgi:hypothetical protein